MGWIMSRRTLDLPAGMGEYLDRTAAYYSLSRGEWLRRANVLPDSDNPIRCGNCGETVKVPGRFPALPIRDVGDPFDLRTSLRVFENGMLEFKMAGEPAVTACPGCSGILLGFLGQIVRLLPSKHLAAITGHGGMIGNLVTFIDHLAGSKAATEKMRQAALESEEPDDFHARIGSVITADGELLIRLRAATSAEATKEAEHVFYESKLPDGWFAEVVRSRTGESISHVGAWPPVRAPALPPAN